MESVINLKQAQPTTILELASMIAKKTNFNSKNEFKPPIAIASPEEKSTIQQPGIISHHHIPGDLENAIEAIIRCIYKDVHRSYEEAKKEMTCNCDDEPLLGYHIFNEVDFVAKNLFPHVKFA